MNDRKEFIYRTDINTYPESGSLKDYQDYSKTNMAIPWVISGILELPGIYPASPDHYFILVSNITLFQNMHKI